MFSGFYYSKTAKKEAWLCFMWCVRNGFCFALVSVCCKTTQGCMVHVCDQGQSCNFNYYNELQNNKVQPPHWDVSVDERFDCQTVIVSEDEPAALAEGA